MDSQNVENIEILTPHSTGQFAKLDAKLSAILEKMDQQSKLTEELIKKVDRQTTELVALRSEVASIKTKVCGEMTRARAYLPLQPFNQLEEFLQFEQTLQDEGVMKNIILDLVKSSEVSCEKFVRSSWRLLLTDEVARQCSWRGTDAKKCVRGFRITLAIRTAFKQRFALEDAEFDRVTQKFFQYPQDRLSKAQKLVASKKKKLETSIDLED
ncbi:hypothetical protein ACLKA6_002019 [Drosophila palustris]